MATFFGSPTVLYHSVNRTNHFLSLQTLRPSLASVNPLSLLYCATPASRMSVGTIEQAEAVSAEVVQLQRSSLFDASGCSKVGTIECLDSTVTRRFGLGAGLALAAFLAAGRELSQQEANSRTIDKEEEVILPNGIRYYDLRVGDGDSSRQGDLVVIDVKGNVESNGEVFVDTFGSDKKSLAMVMGSRPYSKGVCEGIECALRSMKAGGIRRVVVPHNLGYGENGVDFGSGLQIPPFATLEYIVKKVVILPS